MICFAWNKVVYCNDSNFLCCDIYQRCRHVCPEQKEVLFDMVTGYFDMGTVLCLIYTKTAINLGNTQ